MKRSVPILFLVLGTRVLADEPPLALLGSWDLSEPVQDCAKASVQFTKDHHIRMRSGEQTLDAIATYTLKPDGILISLKLVGHNDKPNCQGISADYVAAHFAPFAFVRLQGSTLMFSIVDRSMAVHGPPAKFQRDGV